MPRRRLFGNATLSLVNKFSSGNWSIMDPTNGFTALHHAAYRQLDTESLDRGYFFESDMLFQLGIANAVVMNVPMLPLYRRNQQYEYPQGHAAVSRKVFQQISQAYWV